MEKNKWNPLNIIAFVLAGIFVVSILFYVFIFDNADALFTIAAFLDRPSKSYYLIAERIYKISEKENVGKKILGYLEKGKNKDLHNLYIQFLGITGEKYASACLIRTYVKYQNNSNRRSAAYYAVDSMGLTGSKDTVPLLERLLSNYDRHEMQVTRYSVARALYLITGKNYNYINRHNEKTKLHLTDELISARKVIKASEGRARTFEEMMILDRIFRPPSYRRN